MFLKQILLATQVVESTCNQLGRPALFSKGGMLIPVACASGTGGREDQFGCSGSGGGCRGNVITFTRVINRYVVTTVFSVQPSVFILPGASVTFPYNHSLFLPVKTTLPNPSARGCKVVTGPGPSSWGSPKWV